MYPNVNLLLRHCSFSYYLLSTKPCSMTRDLVSLVCSWEALPESSHVHLTMLYQ